MAKLKAAVWLWSALGILESVGGLVLSLFFQVQGRRGISAGRLCLCPPAALFAELLSNTAFVKRDAPGSSPGIKKAKARGMSGTVPGKQVCLSWKCHADELPFFTSVKERPRAIMENTQALTF